MDLQMPELDGCDTTERLREFGIATPVLALTAGATANERAHALAAGMNDFLTKPVEPGHLVRTIRGHLGL